MNNLNINSPISKRILPAKFPTKAFAAPYLLVREDIETIIKERDTKRDAP